jgi:GTP cyclohydrolase I
VAKYNGSAMNAMKKKQNFLKNGVTIDQPKIIQAVAKILEALGENTQRPGLKTTPQRVAALYAELFSGIGIDLAAVLTPIVEKNAEQMIVVKDIEFYSMCEHHLVPFYGKVHLVYIPQNNIITGFSKLCRLVEITARQLQLQERMTVQMADAIMAALNPAGALVVVEATHLCMLMRGAKNSTARTVTSAIRGLFYNDSAARAEALRLIGR